MRRYRVLLPMKIDTAEGSYTQGDVFEMEYTPEEEHEALNLRGGGLLEIVPQKYKVIGESRVYDTDPGEEFEAALLLGNELALIEGGNIELVEAPKPKPAPKKKKGAK